jgi:hypothetical protein
MPRTVLGDKAGKVEMGRHYPARTAAEIKAGYGSNYLTV